VHKHAGDTKALILKTLDFSPLSEFSVGTASARLDPVAREHFLQFIQRFARVRGAPTMVLVTHHVEEIVPIFSHVLVLNAGRALAAGPRARVLTSATLSDAFAAPVRLTSARDRYSLAVGPHRGIIV
jgi:iron complex transport system ATP-binding protein